MGHPLLVAEPGLGHLGEGCLKFLDRCEEFLLYHGADAGHARVDWGVRGFHGGGGSRRPTFDNSRPERLHGGRGVGRDGLLRLPVGPAWGTWHDQYGFRGLTSLLRPWDGLGPAASLVRDRIRGFDRRGRSARPAPVSGREFFLGLYRGQISDRFRFPPAFPGRSLPSPRPTPPHAAGSGTKLQLIRRAGSSPARCFTTAPPHRSRSPVQPSLCPVALGHPRVQGAHNALGLPSPPMRHRAASSNPDSSRRFAPAL